MVLLLVVELDPGLSALRPFGGYFLLRTTGEPPAPASTFAQVYDHQTSDVYGNPLDFRVARTAVALRTEEPRVAASVAHLGLVARLWSVTLACAVLYGEIPDLAPGLLRWDPGAAAPDDLWLTAVHPLPADRLADVVVDGHLRPLEAALRARHRLAPGLLRGNAASALTGSARQLGLLAARQGRTDAAEQARRHTAALLAHPYLNGTGTLTGTAFRRRSCCLYYRVPGGGVCGDCCFVRPPGSSPHAPSG
ncbi:(2Fe-2S)-binding protein [Streptomyces thermocoprophilus]|uniref:(2Fe-2S)-binding protein n=1 Tax=Streptomyces thermocoprophilus TaxID=78356 RepID=A0ABV5V7U1_9ACTN